MLIKDDWEAWLQDGKAYRLKQLINAAAGNTSYIGLYNAVGSGKFLKVYQIRVTNITGIVQRYTLARYIGAVVGAIQTSINLRMNGNDDFSAGRGNNDIVGAPGGAFIGIRDLWQLPANSLNDIETRTHKPVYEIVEGAGLFVYPNTLNVVVQVEIDFV